jgi:nitroimidazol reductase NimA-like FMN-containing flavoprotein (pyridoxamine 5'-phosphate oxidase superfamily)
MTHAEDTEMSSAEIDAFLGRTETGVISFAREGEPYAIPISYGYDTDGRTFYLRLVSAPESRKREFLSDSPQATLVVYEGDEDASYRSVVATGRLQAVDPATLSPEQIAQYGETKRPLFEIWGQERAELDIKLYEFQPGELSGRRTELDREME